MADSENEDLDRLASAIREKYPTDRRTRIVAIDGFGGSGKTELARRIAMRLDEAAIVHTDDFARPGVRGWEWDRMRGQVLVPLMSDQPGRYRRYDWEADRLAEWHDVPVGGTVIVEGVSSMRDELGKYWDLGVWVAAPYELRLKRGVERDGEHMRAQWTDVWMRQEQEYFNAQRPDKKADLIMDGAQLP
jgi:uridine kinase